MAMHRRRFLAGTALGLGAAPWLGTQAFADIPAAAAGKAAAMESGGTALPARLLSGGETTIPRDHLQQFAASLRGRVLVASDADYESARRIWNGEFDLRPALIARCTGTADVMRSVDFAREHGLLTAVRAGGHSTAGKSSCNGGIMIDVSPMQGVRVDPVARRAYVQAGTLLGQLDHECAAFGLVTTAGTVSHTGAAGLTLGGGFGRVGRRFGLACDNLLAADVVTAAGKRLRAEDSADAELLWGLRGGSGNFGIVTQLEYALHPMDPVILGGRIAWPIAEARDVLRLIAEMHAAAPDELNIEPILVSPPGAPPMIMVEVCWSADHAVGEQRIARLRGFGKPLFDQVRPMRYVDLQAANDVVNPHGVRHYGKAGFLPELSDSTIDAILEVFASTPPGNVNFIFQSSGGAIARVPVAATAFPNRASPWWLMLGANWRDAADSERKLGIARAAWKRVESLTRGFYVNSIDDRADAEIRGNFGPNYDRLVALKKRYDPGNQFRLNANIKPG